MSFPFGSQNSALHSEPGFCRHGCLASAQCPQKPTGKTHLFSLSHMTSLGGTEQLPKSLQDKHYKPPSRGGVQAGSVESEQPLSLQRSWEQGLWAHAVSRGQNPAEEGRRRWGKPSLPPGDRNTGRGAHCCFSWEPTDFKFPFTVAIIKTITQKS